MKRKPIILRSYSESSLFRWCLVNGNVRFYYCTCYNIGKRNNWYVPLLKYVNKSKYIYVIWYNLSIGSGEFNSIITLWHFGFPSAIMTYSKKKSILFVMNLNRMNLPMNWNDLSCFIDFCLSVKWQHYYYSHRSTFMIIYDELLA